MQSIEKRHKVKNTPILSVKGKILGKDDLKSMNVKGREKETHSGKKGTGAREEGKITFAKEMSEDDRVIATRARKRRVTRNLVPLI